MDLEMEDLFDEWFLGRTFLEPDGNWTTYMECQVCGALVRDGGWGEATPAIRHLRFHRSVS